MSQENNQQTSTNEKQHSNLESVQLIVDGINIWQNNGYSLPLNILPAYAYRATIAVREIAIPDMVKMRITSAWLIFLVRKLIYK